jgi:hypothetical protein
MNKIDAITSFTRNSMAYGLTVKEACIIIAVAGICANKAAIGLVPKATQAEVNLMTSMEMRSTISRLKFWLEFKRRKTGKVHKSYYWLNAKGIETVNNLLDFKIIGIQELMDIATYKKQY